MDIPSLTQTLLDRVANSTNPQEVLRAPEFRELYSQIPKQAPEHRATFGQQVNQLKQAVEQAVAERKAELEQVSRSPIDVTAPFDVNSVKPSLLDASVGTIHPITNEIKFMSDILNRMGFQIYESREIDDQYHMFDTLNFPKGHPARDDYDTFLTIETDRDGEPFVAPAHTSTMQHRILKKYRGNLDKNEPSAAVVPDRVFRNEDLDARHEHTFYQVEGVYVSKNVTVGMLIATLQTFLEEYYGKSLEIRTNPFYFPFTEPSLEFALSCPFCDKKGCKVCSFEGWIELIGCGMIHPNVLRMADIDPDIYTGFAWGLGIDRLVMMKNGIEDVRHFESAKLDFLRQF